ncbi:hypothetical protein COV61_00750 [Candidatus Micrarchaeota archaeon CG11_big_fil_rev_8_21_14_0_20_47_5]|nr:MAG: hypothetical protein COV61_00750 [Candidatus Micrarchaeota archaeon CG11_big_fil_rev_8_21_14_0_20_47_5]
MYEYDVIIEQDENKVFVVSVPALPGCHTEGDTMEEAMDNIREAVELYLEHSREKVENPMRFVAVKKLSFQRSSVAGA